MRVSLSIMLDSCAGCAEPLQQLLTLLRSYDIKATFFVATGVDRSLSWAKRVGHQGRIEQCAGLEAIVEAGHDLGMSCHDPVRWKSKAAFADQHWLRDQWRRGYDAWSERFNTKPMMHAAVGYQLHPELFVCEQQAGLLFASDTRGQTPFYPVMQDVSSTVMQLPVTVASAEEMLRISPGCVTHLHQELFDASLKILPQGQHWRIVAGHDDSDLVEKLIVMWRGTSKEFVTLKQLAQEFSVHPNVRQHQVGWKTLGETCYAAQGLPVSEEM